uniref:HTH cro/C1-type domain-containing protein n=1 Tax=uncultured prokaryote TaxID=198431 RepID=A0A0H5Q551_9ZZZZ|nr:hypothetical protein [uncultured prokaryote]
MKLGMQIKQRRKELNLTQEELAKRINVSRSAVSNWEIGRNYPDIQLIIQLSDELDISLDKLLKGESLVVKQISNDTIVRKSLSRKVKILYGIILFLLMLGILFFYKTNEYSDISNSTQVKTLTVEDQTIHVTTDLPFYRSLIAYTTNNSPDGKSLEIALSTKLDLSMKNNNELDIPLNISMPSDLDQINIIHNGNIIKSFPLK